MEPPRKRVQRTELVGHLNGTRIRIERRNGGPNLFASAYFQGKNIVKCTDEKTLSAASKAAFEWYSKLWSRAERGERLHVLLFAHSVASFLKHAEAVKEVSPGQIQNYRHKWSLLQKAFENVPTASVDLSFMLDLRNKRAGTLTKAGKRVSNATLKKDIDFVRVVLRHACEVEKSIGKVPQFPSFRGKQWKVLANKRPFLSAKDWNVVRRVAERRAKEAGLNPRTRRQRQELLSFMMLCVGAALRVEEAYSLRWKDCAIVPLDDPHKTTSVHLKVFGKHTESNYIREDAYALYAGVLGFKRLQTLYPDAKPDENLFRETHRDGMRELLIAAKLRTNADGISRDSKSLRQTGISLRLDEGPNPDYRDIAKWARTSVTEIGRFYDQSHPKGSVERITGFRDVPFDGGSKKSVKPPKSGRKPKRGRKFSNIPLPKLRRMVDREEEDDPLEPWERAHDDNPDTEGEEPE